jgi:hypothetical protein
MNSLGLSCLRVGAIEYDWEGGYNNGPASGAVCYDCSIYRRVTERRVYANGANLESRMTFSKPDTFVNSLVQSSAYIEVNDYDAASRLMSTTLHYYYGSAWGSVQPNDPIYYNTWDEGKEYRTDVIDASGTVLRRVTDTWDKTAPTWTLGPASNPRITQSVTTIEPDAANLTTSRPSRTISTTTKPRGMNTITTVMSSVDCILST